MCCVLKVQLKCPEDEGSSLNVLMYYYKYTYTYTKSLTRKNFVILIMIGSQKKIQFIYGYIKFHCYI